MHITIYTDGSCHAQQKIGAWVAIISCEAALTTLSGIAENTTHQQMELKAVISALSFIPSLTKHPEKVTLITDSQYISDLPKRSVRLQQVSFITKKGNVLPNAEAVQQLINLLQQFPAEIIKVKAHQTITGVTELQQAADKLSRKLVRENITR